MNVGQGEIAKSEVRGESSDVEVRVVFSDFPSLLFEIGAEFPSSNIMIIGFGLVFPPHPPGVVLQVRRCLIWPIRPLVYSSNLALS